MRITFLSENLKRREHLEDLDVDERRTVDWISRETGCEGVEWMLLAQDRDQWRVLVDMVMNFCVP
jgi:hypothetical protein